MNTGLNIVGVFKGFKSTPWKSDPSKFNHQIGIATYLNDGFGGQKENITLIDILTQDIEYIQSHQNDFIGKLVSLPVVARAKNKDWLTFFKPVDTKIELLANPVKPDLKKAS